MSLFHISIIAVCLCTLAPDVSSLMSDVFAGFASQDSSNKPADGDYIIACLGDSITWGQGSSGIYTNSYPVLLGEYLGEGYWVGNFGVQSVTMSKQGDISYWDQAEFESALEIHPDTVVTMFGTNDAKTQNWNPQAYYNAYKDMIFEFFLGGAQNILVMTPPPVYERNYGIQAIVVNRLLPGYQNNSGMLPMLVDEVHETLKNGTVTVLAQNKSGTYRIFLVDVYDELGGFERNCSECFYETGGDKYGTNDGVHPTDTGHSLIYRNVLSALVENGIYAKNTVQTSEEVSSSPLTDDTSAFASSDQNTSASVASDKNTSATVASGKAREQKDGRHPLVHYIVPAILIAAAIFGVATWRTRSSAWRTAARSANRNLDERALGKTYQAVFDDNDVVPQNNNEIEKL